MIESDDWLSGIGDCSSEIRQLYDPELGRFYDNVEGNIASIITPLVKGELTKLDSVIQ